MNESYKNWKGEKTCKAERQKSAFSIVPATAPSNEDKRQNYMGYTKFY